MNRPRACAAVLHADRILMVQHRNGSRTYWTLPGGGVNRNESLGQAVAREVKEETGLDVSVGQLLFTEDYEFGKSYCFLATLTGDETEPSLAYLPDEEAIFGTMVLSVTWHPIQEMKDDIQVSKVIAALGLTPA